MSPPKSRYRTIPAGFSLSLPGARYTLMSSVMSQTSQITQPEAALVLFSGGQDSTTCLAWALARFAAVETIGFDYGQRHRVELECRLRIAERLRREFPQWGGRLGPDHVIDLGVLG